MAYYHGVKTSEVETSLISPVETENSLPFIVGTAPVHLTNGKVNEPILCYQYKEFVQNFGESKDYEKYTLNEAAYCEFALFNQAPAVFVNVLDPDKHYNAIQFTASGVESTPVTIEGAVIEDTLEITSSGTTLTTLTGSVDYTETVDPVTSDVTIALLVNATLPASVPINVDYDSGTTPVSITVQQSNFPYVISAPCANVVISANVPFTNTLVKNVDYVGGFIDENHYRITIINNSQIVNDTIQIRYHELDASQVTADDIIGGYDNLTGKNTGLELIEEVFPKYRLVPSIICIPKYSTKNSVVAVMKAKTTNINGLWKAIALADIPTDTVQVYSDVPGYKQDNNLVDENLVICWPKVALDGQQFHLSTQLMGLCQQVAAERNDLPYKSPSNENIQCDSLVLADGTEIRITLTQANYLNSQGIYTALNFVNGFVGWGNESSAFPGTSDVKDRFIAVRRFFNYLNNILILTYWQRIDDPMNKNLVEACLDSVNLYLNGLVAAGALIAGRVELHEDENPTTDLLAGILKFHVFLTVPVPCQTLSFILEYDTTALSTLFD